MLLLIEDDGQWARFRERQSGSRDVVRLFGDAQPALSGCLEVVVDANKVCRTLLSERLLRHCHHVRHVGQLASKRVFRMFDEILTNPSHRTAVRRLDNQEF